MIQRGEDLRLPLESRRIVRVLRELRGQDLHRHIAIEPRIVRAVHLSHSAGAQQPDDLIYANACSGGKGHARSILS